MYIMDMFAGCQIQWTQKNLHGDWDQEDENEILQFRNSQGIICDSSICQRGKCFRTFLNVLLNLGLEVLLMWFEQT